MSNAVQTIQGANAGITSISSLIAQAQAIAQSAQASTVGVYGQAAITLSSVVSGDTVTVGGMTFTAVSAGAGTTQFNVGSTDTATAANLETAISAAFAASSASTGNANATAVSGNVITLTGTTTNMSVGISGTATVSGSADIAAATVPNSNTQADRENYRLQYSTLLTQLDKLAQDSGYNGTNLLNGDTLNVAFGTGATDQIAITGFTATSAGLSLTAGAADSWGTNAGIQTSVNALSAAQTTVNNQSANLSSGLSIINTRQTWVTSMINTLQTGANNLTLADMNQEGADMLMLQTQQSLGTTALSLSSQAAQSVLKLFP